MTTKTDEQIRAEFEEAMDGLLFDRSDDGTYTSSVTRVALEAYQAGRAALQSQDREDRARIDWLESSTEPHGFCHVGNGDYRFYAHQQDGYKTVREAIDHARRIKGET